MRLPPVPRNKLAGKKKLLKDFFKTIQPKSGSIHSFGTLLLIARTSSIESISRNQERVLQSLSRLLQTVYK
jgi:hypothetical protein